MIKFFLPLVIGLASIIGIGDLIHGCVNDNSGAIRIVSSAEACTDEETSLDWSVMGNPGPKGDPGPQGPKGDPGAGVELAALEARVVTLEATVAALEAKLVHVTTEGNEITISGANLHVVNGTGDTQTTNGLGNVIIGYNEERTPDEETEFGSANDRSGSHMLVVGTRLNYNKTGGIVVGFGSSTTGNFSTVSGGRNNRAEGSFSSISGGNNNIATGGSSAVTGGYSNIASGDYSTVSGGQHNQATGGADKLFQASSISGGSRNVAEGQDSSVSGGHLNTASGDASSVSGGASRSADNPSDWRGGALLQDD